MVGQTLGHYKILDKLGAGGMGEVYRAEDSTLKRQVALKVLPADLASSTDRLERFQREAETLAALDHPNIVTVFTVERSEDLHFLTMQLVKGQRLSDCIPKGGMPLERIFETAIPLADALAAAHEKGVIHRDLKPANIMVTDDGQVKVLDFGLAKLHREDEAAIATQLPTEPLTEKGRAIGTVPYMSPEQAEGKEIDHRSDMFSLGILLFEMATGERPFQGDSPASVMSAILRHTPPSVTELAGTLPRDLAKIIRRCLVKDPERRFQTARELKIELEELRGEVESGEAWQPLGSLPARRRVLPWTGILAACLLLVAVAALVLWTLRQGRGTVAGDSRAATASFTKLVFDTSQKGGISASPDGSFFVYASDAAGNWDIYLRRIGGSNAINLTENSGADDYQPSFSPDGESIAFRSERDGGGIFVMGATGESARRITETGFHPSWSPDGAKLLLSTALAGGGYATVLDERTLTVNLATGEVKQLLERSAVCARWSPNGLRISYWGIWRPSEAEELIGLFTVRPDGTDPLLLTADAGDSHAWSADGQGIYFVSWRGGSTGDLWRIGIDEHSGRVVGDAVPITSGSGVSQVSPAADGKRILLTSRKGHHQILRLPFDPSVEKVVGTAKSITPLGLQAMFPAVSPDGEWIAFSAFFGQAGRLNIGVVRNDGGSLRQLTDTGSRDWFPRWSPNGQQLFFSEGDLGSGNERIWIVRADGGGLRQLADASLGLNPPIFSPDGSRLAVNTSGGETTWIFQAGKPWDAATREALPPIGAPQDRFMPNSWSADGRRLAGGRWRVEREDQAERVAIYDFETERYRTYPGPLGSWARSNWLNDSRRLLVCSGERDETSRIFILDTESGETRKVITSEEVSAMPDVHSGRLCFPAISPDNRSLYLDWRYSQTDIWLLTLEG